MNGLGSAGHNLLVFEEGVECTDAHPESLGLGTHKASHSTEGLDAQAFAGNLAAGGGSELGTGHEYHEGYGKFGDGV